MDITFKSAGIDELISGMEKFSRDLPLNEVKAVNKVITSARADAATRITDQVNLTRAYLGSPNDPNARLAIKKRATRNDVEAVISARRRPTSLANPSFLRSRKPGDVTVAVHGSFPKRMRGAFIVRLNNGNDGLAIRVHAGSALRNSRGAKRLSNNVYLLYGPSVDQVFQTVREDIAPKAIADLRNEIIRLQRIK